MTYKELTSKTLAELIKLDKELRNELFQLKLKQKTAQLEKTHQLKTIRKDIARVQHKMSELNKANI